jgi:hypothetical protein
MFEWIRSLFTWPAAGKVEPPKAALEGLPIEINVARHSRAALMRHAGRLVTLYGVAAPSQSIKSEIERRRGELGRLIGVEPRSAVEAASLLDKLRS